MGVSGFFSKLRFCGFLLFGTSACFINADFVYRPFCDPGLFSKGPFFDPFVLRESNQESGEVWKTGWRFGSCFDTTMLSRDEQKKVFGSVLPESLFTNLSNQAKHLLEDLRMFSLGIPNKIDGILDVAGRTCFEAHSATILANYSRAMRVFNYPLALAFSFGLTPVFKHPNIFDKKQADLDEIKGFVQTIANANSSLAHSSNGLGALNLRVALKSRLLVSPLELSAFLTGPENKYFKSCFGLHVAPGVLALDSSQDYQSLDWSNIRSLSRPIDSHKNRFLANHIIQATFEDFQVSREPEVAKIARFVVDSTPAEHTRCGLGVGASLSLKKSFELARFDMSRAIDLSFNCKSLLFGRVDQKMLFFATNPDNYVLGAGGVLSKQIFVDLYAGAATCLYRDLNLTLGLSGIFSRNFDFSLPSSGDHFSVLQSIDWAKNYILAQLEESAFGYLFRLHGAINGCFELAGTKINLACGLFSDALSSRFIQKKGFQCSLELQF